MLERCCLPRLIELGGRSYRLAPPTLRQAVELLNVIATRSDRADDELLLQLITALEWKPQPLSLRAVFFANTAKVCNAIQSAIWQGYSLPDSYEKEEKEEKEGSKRYDWNRALTSYCMTYGGDPWTVWNTTPFSFFIQKLNTYAQDRAIVETSLARSTNPSKETVKQWTEILKSGKSEKSENEMLFERLTPEEIEKEKELAKKTYMKK